MTGYAIVRLCEYNYFLINELPETLSYISEQIDRDNEPSPKLVLSIEKLKTLMSGQYADYKRAGT